jgi:hypothetical protein
MKKRRKELDRSYRHALTVRLGPSIMARLYAYQELCIKQEDRRSIPLLELIERLVNSGKLASAKAVEDLNGQSDEGYSHQLCLRLDQSTMERLRRAQERISKDREKKATLVYSLQRIIAAAPTQ